MSEDLLQVPLNSSGAYDHQHSLGSTGYGSIDTIGHPKPHQNLTPDYPVCNSKPPNSLNTKKFRYIICFIVLIAYVVKYYIHGVLYVVSIKMIASDVAEAGITELRALHISRDPLAESRNAASPGTCPIEAAPNAELQNPIAQTVTKIVSVANQSLANLTQISIQEHEALANETKKLMQQIDHSIATGYLVNWSIEQRSLMFTAHTIGGVLLSLPVARFGMTHGNRLVITLCLLSSVIHAMLFPTVVAQSPYWLVLLFEMTFGSLSEGLALMIYPISASWLLVGEANVVIAFLASAAPLGNALTNFVTTQLLSNGVTWQWCFYLPGFLMALLATTWYFIGSDEPKTNKYVTEEEKSILENSVAELKERENKFHRQFDPSQCVCNEPTCPARKFNRVPNWYAIATCPTVIALVVVRFAAHWNMRTSTLWPTYFANILHLDTSIIGYIIGLEGIIVILVSLLIAFYTRNMSIQRPFNMSLTSYRRVNQFIATMSLGVSVMLMVTFDCSIVATITSVMLTPLVTSFNSISFMQIALDFAAEDSALIMSFTRFLSIGDIVAMPVSSSILAQSNATATGDRYTWRIVWLLGFSLKAFACLYFCLFASSTKDRTYSNLKPSARCRALEHPLLSPEEEKRLKLKQ